MTHLDLANEIAYEHMLWLRRHHGSRRRPPTYALRALGFPVSGRETWDDAYAYLVKAWLSLGT